MRSDEHEAFWKQLEQRGVRLLTRNGAVVSTREAEVRLGPDYDDLLAPLYAQWGSDGEVSALSFPLTPTAMRAVVSLDAETLADWKWTWDDGGTGRAQNLAELEAWQESAVVSSAYLEGDTDREGWVRLLKRLGAVELVR